MLIWKGIKESGRTSSLIAAIGCSLLLGCATGQPTVTPSKLPIERVNLSDARNNSSLPLIDAETDDWPDTDVPATAVRWGGTITRIENLADGKTLLEIVSRPLRRNGRPMHNDASAGRFIALVQEFLEPQIVKAGRDMTVTGPLIARKNGLIGKTELVFPVVQAETYTLWKPLPETVQYHVPLWNTYPGRYPDPFYNDPLWPSWIIYRPPP